VTGCTVAVSVALRVFRFVTSQDRTEVPYLAVPADGILRLKERPTLGQVVGQIKGGSVTPTDVIAVELTPNFGNTALGRTPAFTYNRFSSNLLCALSGTQLSYDAGLRNVTLNFTLTNPGVTPSGSILPPGPISVNVTVVVVIDSTAVIVPSPWFYCLTRLAFVDVNQFPYLVSSANPAVPAFSAQPFYTFTLGDDDQDSRYHSTIVSGNTNASLSVSGNFSCVVQ
jgi:hypothetical protein